jgi:hypothetical protein
VTSGFEGFSGAQGNVSNMIFGGPDLKTLYFTGDGGLYSIRLKVPGRPRYGNPTALRPMRTHGPANIQGIPALQKRDVRGRSLEAPMKILR